MRTVNLLSLSVLVLIGCGKKQIEKPIVDNTESKAVVTTVAGRGNPGNYEEDGSLTTAYFNQPRGIVKDSKGAIYVTEYYNEIIKKITITDDKVATLAGSRYLVGLRDGPGDVAIFRDPYGLAIDKSDNIYIADCGGNAIRKMTTDGYVTTICGTAEALGLGYVDGSLSEARFHNPTAIAVDNDNNLYVVDQGNSVIRKISAAGQVTTIAGDGVKGYIDGDAKKARFQGATGICVDSKHNIYVADGNGCIRLITPDGIVSTFAPAIGVVSGVAVDASDNVYASLTNLNTIVKITKDKTHVILAGGIDGFADGIGVKAMFSRPYGIFVGSANDIYVTDLGNFRIRKIVQN